MPVHIIAEECIGCSACEAECEKGAIFLQDLHFQVDPQYCACQEFLCVDVCPSGAIVPLTEPGEVVHRDRAIYYRNTGAL